MNEARLFKYDAVILSAGDSSRMGYPKALLDAGGQTFLEKIIVNTKNTKPQPDKIIIVMGRHKEIIKNNVNLSGCIVVQNPDPSRGMLSSIKEALNFTGKDTSGILLLLVDHPLADSTTYQRLINAACENPGKIVQPTFHGQNGHPVFFPSVIFKDLLNAPLDEGARWAVRKNSDKIIKLQVEDSGIVADVDTIPIYESLFGKINLIKDIYES